MGESLKAQTAVSLKWSGAETVVRQGLQFGFAILLARLLTPHDFGVMALMVVFVGVSNALADGGFGAALVQRPNLTPGEINAVFYFNIAVGAAVALVLAAAAGSIARFFDTPILEAATYMAAINVMVTSFGVVQLALLVKKLDFRSYFFVTVLSSGLGGVVAVALAWCGWGVWSLVWQALLVGLLSTTMLWWVVAWRPRGGVCWRELLPMWKFGGAVMLSSILEMLAGRLSSVLIGRAYTIGDLGLFSRAESTRDMASTLVSRPVTRVAFPVFSAATGNQQLMVNALRKTLRFVMYFNIPGMAALGFLAPQLIPVIYGDQWIPAVPFLQILSLAGLVVPMCLVNLEFLKSTGNASLYFRAEMVKKGLVVAGVLAAFTFSIEAIAWSQVAAMAVFSVLVAHWSGRLLDYGLLRQLRDLWQPIGATICMLMAIGGVGLVFQPDPIVRLLTEALIGALTYLVTSWLLRSEIQKEMLAHVWSVAARRLGGVR